MNHDELRLHIKRQHRFHPGFFTRADMDAFEGLHEALHGHSVRRCDTNHDIAYAGLHRGPAVKEAQ